MIGDERSIDELIAASSIGQGLADIKERGIDAHLEDLEQEMAPKKKRKKSTSPTARTLAELRKRGWTAQVVEQHLPFPKPFGTKRDLFGVIDIVAIAPVMTPASGQLMGREIVGIQATADSANHAHRRTKILAEPRAKQWVEAGGRLELWSWSRRVARKQDGSKAKRPVWTLRVETYEQMRASQESEAG